MREGAKVHASWRLNSGRPRVLSARDCFREWHPPAQALLVKPIVLLVVSGGLTMDNKADSSLVYEVRLGVDSAKPLGAR